MAIKNKNTSVIVLVAAAVVVLGVIYVGIKHMSASTEPSAISQMDSKPFTNAEIEGFVSHDFPKVLTFDTDTDLPTHMTNIKPYLTDNGVKDIQDALRMSRILEHGASSEVHFTARPKVVETKGKGASQEWKVEALLEQEFIRNGKSLKSSLKTVLVVMPKDDPENYLGIDKMIIIPQ